MIRTEVGLQQYYNKGKYVRNGLPYESIKADRYPFFCILVNLMRDQARITYKIHFLQSKLINR